MNIFLIFDCYTNTQLRCVNLFKETGCEAIIKNCVTLGQCSLYNQVTQHCQLAWTQTGGRQTQKLVGHDEHYVNRNSRRFCRC